MKFNKEYGENSERDPLTQKVIGCAIEVHRNLGPGLLESTYQQCLAYELYLVGLSVKVQVPMPVKYKNIKLDCGYRIDLLVENCLILELKALEQVSGIHEAQLLSYMKLAGAPIGLLINFNVTLLKNGIRRLFLLPSLLSLFSLLYLPQF